ncbi:MAG: four-carbon acid sugar kinase family protein [Rubrobacteraceae bacterium]
MVGSGKGIEPVDAAAYLRAQPSGRCEGEFLREIQDRVAADGRKVVVLDDDPTGVQSVHDVPVLADWPVEELRWGLSQESPTFFVLTNSRALPEDRAVEMNREIVRALAEAAEDVGVDFVIISRSDSTLRGHYPAETDALAETLEERIDGVILCLCFFEAGRITVNDIHWVRQGDRLVPVGLTEFASDHSFGFASSDLKEWVAEKTGGRIPASEVTSISLSDIRDSGPERVSELLGGVESGLPVVVNAEHYGDLEVFVLGLLDAEAVGKRFIYRTGPSFARARGGITPPSILGPEDLRRRGTPGGHGLVLVGSYVPTTTEQLREALALDGVESFEISVRRLLEPAARRAEIERAVSGVNRALRSREVILYTSRDLVMADSLADGERSDLDVGSAVSNALVEVMRRVDRALELSFVIAKGGITSSEVGTRGLGVKRAHVAGPLLPPGIVPVWMLPEDNDFPGLPYVIFPGNVGGPDSLARAIEILREAAR